MKYLSPFSKKIRTIKWYWFLIFALLIFAVGLRIFFLPTLGFPGDFGSFNAWARDLSQYGFNNFYQNSSCNYLPIYVYLLKFSSLIQPMIHQINSVWSSDQVTWISYRLPCLVFDLLTTYFIYLLIFKKTKNKLLGALGSIFYLYNPAIFHNTYIYGQNNVLLYFPAVLLFYALSEKKFIIAGIAMAVLLLIKPTGIIIAPFALLLLILENKKNYKVYIKFFLAFYLSLQLLILPFYFRLPWEYANMFWQSLTSGNGYKVTQMFSYNFWYLITGSSISISDATKFWGKSYYFWGQLMFATSYLISLILLVFSRTKNYLILATIVYFSFFVFPTRVHEGYLMFAFPIFILAVFAYKNYFLGLVYILSTLFYSYNIWSYWPWKLSNYVSIHYGGRFSEPAAYVITFTPIILFFYFLLAKKNDQPIH